MSRLPQSDLILAGRYVDGDLSAPEVEAAESKIAADVGFAAEVDRIRQQQRQLQMLPDFKPASDLHERTLQASLDQVKAIMGAWPVDDGSADIEPAGEVLTPRSDWKSTAALVASLAGVVMLGLILWQNSQQGGTPSLASNSGFGDALTKPDDNAPSIGKAMASKNPVTSEPSFKGDVSAQIGEVESASQATESIDIKNEPQVASNSGSGFTDQNGIGFNRGLSGTPLKAPSVAKNAVGNSPVAQVWWVNQNKAVPNNNVSDILRSNRIDVQHERQEELLSSNRVEAFYIAATPSQMKQALSDISNNAETEILMFEMPGENDSPIANVIQNQLLQQQTEASDGGGDPSSQQSIDPLAPPRFAPYSNALAQQLPMNDFRRIHPPANPPRILNSDSLNKDLTQKAPQPAATKSAAPNAAPAARAKGSGVVTDKQKSVAAITKKGPVQSAMPTNSKMTQSYQQGEFDRFLDDSDRQLRQYLILVNGNEAGSQLESDASIKQQK